MKTNRLQAPACATLLAALMALSFDTGCSVRRFAMKKVADALANSGTTFASDDDPILVRDAVPFSLKLMESLLAENPRHRGLLLAASRGFTQYAYAFVQEESEERAEGDLAAANELRSRARRLYLRARNYGLRGLEVRHRGFGEALRSDPKAAVAAVTSPAEVPLLYWTAASWGAAIAQSKDNPDLVADQLIVEALIDRALALDETFEAGAIHSFLVNYESSRQPPGKDAAERSRRHFERAIELSQGNLASPYVALAEANSVAAQNRAEFEELLHKALAVDADARPEWRLENLVMQRRARWLLGRVSQLFAE